MLQNAYFLAKIGADTAENEQHFAEILPTDALAVPAAPRVRPQHLHGAGHAGAGGAGLPGPRRKKTAGASRTAKLEAEKVTGSIRHTCRRGLER